MKTIWIALALVSNLGGAAGFEPLETRFAELKILTTNKGMTVYVFDKDVNGVPSCYNACAGFWPPVIAPEGEVQPPLSIATRTDGKRQLLFNGRPLYLYQNDSQEGDILGDGLNGTWHVVHP